MLSNIVIAAFASLAIVVVDAAPTVSQRATGLISDCTDVTLRSNWLVGSCLADDGTTRVQSSVYLPSKITNSEGVLGWKAGGGYSASCKSCKITDGSTLDCVCSGTFNNSDKNATLSLDEHIHSYDGHLLTDQFGTPTIPPTSTVAVPQDFGWSLGMGAGNCYSTDPNYDTSFCGNITDTTCPASTNGWVSANAPAPCRAFTIPVSAPILMQYEKLRVTAASKAIEFVVYDNKDCSGTPITTMKPAEYDTCKVFSKAARAVKTNLLWNADIS